MELEIEKREIGLVVDTETTGLEIKAAKICQMAAVLVESSADGLGFPVAEEGQPRSLRSTDLLLLMHPGEPIPAECSAIHGITDDMVKFAMSEELGLQWLGKVLQDYQELGDSHEVFILGYNIERFDLPLIEFRARSYGLESPHVWDFKAIDLFPLVQRLDPEGRHKLSEAWSDMMGQEAVNAHDAAADCHMVADVLDAVMDAQGYTSLSELYEWSREPQVYTTMPFGKHKGKHADEVPYGYWKYLYKEIEPGDMSRDFRATIMHYLEKN